MACKTKCTSCDGSGKEKIYNGAKFRYEFTNEACGMCDGTGKMIIGCTFPIKPISTRKPRAGEPGTTWTYSISTYRCIYCGATEERNNDTY